MTALNVELNFRSREPIYIQIMTQIKHMIATGTLQPGDSLVVARIDSGSFSEKDIVCKMTFDGRPSVANQQKRRFRGQIDEFVARITELGPSPLRRAAGDADFTSRPVAPEVEVSPS